MNKDDIINLYKKGTSENKISTMCGRSRRYVRRILSDAGVPIRGVKDANALYVLSLSAKEKAYKASFAQSAVRGKKRSHKELLERARTRENNPVFNVSRYEIDIAEEMLKRKIKFIPQKQFDIYNVDFYIENKVVLEVFGGGWHGSSDRHIDNFKRKSHHLFDLDIPIVVCWSAQVFDVTKVVDRIEEILNSNLDVKHYVMRGNGNKSIMGHKTLEYIL